MDFVGIVALLAFRTVPFVLYALLTPAVKASSRAIWLLVFGAVLVGAHAAGAPMYDVIIGAPMALLYFTGVGLLVHRISLSRVRRLFGVLSLVPLGGVCFLLPAIALPRAFVLPTLVIGWEVALSAHGYLMDMASGKTPPKAADLLFFLLVNPSLAYAERGSKDESPNIPWGASRCLAGVAAWVGQDAVVAFMQPQVPVPPLTTAGTVTGYWNFATVYAALFVAYYLGQSGLASFRIGLMALLGYRTPECFHRPFFSQSPQDFWQRWNMWVGAWARRYVFFPTSFALRRQNPNMPSGLAIAITTISTFVIVGALHDALKWCARVQEHSAGMPPKGLVFFALSGAALLVSAGLGALFERFAPGFLRRKTWLSWVTRAVLTLNLLWLTHALTLTLLPDSTVQPGGW